MFSGLRRLLRPRTPPSQNPPNHDRPNPLPLTIGAGSVLYLGRPAVPVSTSFADALTNLLLPIDAVTEAHIPQCYAPAIMKDAAQVLVVVFPEAAGHYSETKAHIMKSVAALCPPGSHLDVWFMWHGHGNLHAVRNANCRIK